MSPNRPITGRKHGKLIQRLANWSDQNGTGDVYYATSEFAFQNGAKRAPDASWILKRGWDALTPEEQESVPAPICPDFVVEVRSPNDLMNRLKAKMDEYMANGVRLAWLLDPIDNRPSESVLSGDPILPGFRFDFREIL
jgi:Uma2 family endonuclease